MTECCEGGGGRESWVERHRPCAAVLCSFRHSLAPLSHLLTCPGSAGPSETRTGLVEVGAGRVGWAPCGQRRLPRPRPRPRHWRRRTPGAARRRRRRRPGRWSWDEAVCVCVCVRAPGVLLQPLQGASAGWGARGSEKKTWEWGERAPFPCRSQAPPRAPSLTSFLASLGLPSPPPSDRRPRRSHTPGGTHQGVRSPSGPGFGI